MRVDNFNKVSQLYQSNSTKKLEKTTKSSQSDKLELSQTGKDYQVAKQAVMKAPDVRMDKVNDIKRRMESGTYNISSQEIASKMVDSYFSTIA